MIAFDPHVSAEVAQAAGVPLMSLEALLPQTDILSLHVPATAETRGIVNARTLALLKPGAILINTARGPVVDEAALWAALASGRLAGAGLDVLQQEPIRLPHPLTEFENVVFTCHYASLSEESYAIMRREVSDPSGANPAWRVPAKPGERPGERCATVPLAPRRREVGRCNFPESGISFTAGSA